jgi:hypothetical protein
MNGFLEAIYQGVTNVSARDATGGLLIGLVMALAASKGCLILKKRIADPFPMLCGMILLVSVLSMALGLGYSHSQSDRTGRSLSASQRASGLGVLPPPIGRRLIDDADLNGDHRLTPEEAARFVKGADLAGKGWANASDIDQARRPWIAPRRIQDFHPDTAHRAPSREGF